MTLLRRTWNHFIKSLTILKRTFHESAHENFLSSKFDNELSIFFSEQLDQQLTLYQNLLGLWHSYLEPQIIWTSPDYNENDFSGKCPRIFLARILTTCEYFVLRQFRSTINPLSEPNRTMTLLRRTSNHLNKSLTILKRTFHENANEYFLSSKFDNVLSTFFSDQLDQQLALYQNVKGLWDSYVDPQIIWTSPWL